MGVAERRLNRRGIGGHNRLGAVQESVTLEPPPLKSIRLFRGSLPQVRLLRISLLNLHHSLFFPPMCGLIGYRRKEQIILFYFPFPNLSPQ